MNLLKIKLMLIFSCMSMQLFASQSQINVKGTISVIESREAQKFE